MQGRKYTCETICWNHGDATWRNNWKIKNKKKVWHNQQQSDDQALACLQRQTALSGESRCFHGCCTPLFLLSRLHSAPLCCHAQHSRPRSPLHGARERKERQSGREVEERTLLSQGETKDALWKDKPYCCVLFLLQTAPRPNNMWTYCTSRNDCTIPSQPEPELWRPEGGFLIVFT